MDILKDYKNGVRDFSEADLKGADLSEADLEGADLEGAKLCGANLERAKNVFIFNKIGGRTCYAVVHDTCLMILAGCFWGTLDEFEAAALEKYGDDENKNYKAQIQYLRQIQKMVICDS